MVPYILVIKVSLKFQLDVFYLFIYLFIYLSALHVSGYAHLQELQMYFATIGVCTSFDVLLHWIGYWLGHPHTFVTVRFRHIKTSTHTYGLQSTFEAPEDGRSPKHVEPTK